MLPENSFAHGDEKHSGSTSSGDITYTKHIEPIFKKRCAKCHGANSPEHMEFVKDIKHYKKKMKGPKMDNYTHLTSFVIWPDTASLMKALDNGKNNEKGNPGKMFKYLGKNDEERQQNLKLFKNWVGYWTLKSWSEIEKKDIDRMKLSY